MAWGILWRIFVTLIVHNLVFLVCWMATPLRPYLYDPQFSVWNLSIGYASFACLLFASLACLDRGALFLCFGRVLSDDRSFWRSLTKWAAGFYVVMAALNLLIGKNLSYNAWLGAKTFGPLVALLAFSLVIPRFLRAWNS
jgi:intracellular septation protein A